MATATTYALNPFEGHGDVGAVQISGSYQFNAAAQTFTISSAGSNIWGDHDQFHFVWRKMRGDFIVTSRAAFIGTGVNPHRKLGWMARTSLDTSAPQICTGIHGDGLLSLQYRRAQGGITEEVRAPLVGADVIQLERRGNTCLMSVAQFGQPFTAVQVDDLDLGEEVYVGLFVCSHEDQVVEKAVFRDVRVVVPVKADFNRDKDPFGSRLELLDVTSGQRQIVYSSTEVFEAPNWTLDGKALIFNSLGHLRRFDLATRTVTPIDTADVVRNNNDHVISFDGSMLAISSHTGPENHSMIYTVPLGGGQPKQITPGGPSYLHGWSPDGKYLVYCAQRNGEYNIFRIRAEGGPEVQLTSGPWLDDGPEYTPDGKYIYFNSVRTGRMHIWRMKADGSNQEQLTNDEYNNWFAHIAPDGQSIVFVTYMVNEVAPSDHPAAKRVYLRRMALDGSTPDVLAYLYGGQGTMNVPSWSPDGKMIAFVSNTVPFS